jgi:hypothetical protein
MDAKSGFTVCGLLHRRRRVRVGKIGLASTVQRARVPVEIGPARATCADSREFEMGRVYACALEYRVLGVLIGPRSIVAPENRYRSVFFPCYVE